MPPRHQHGGRLQEAAARYGIPVSDWLDLSTGINPNGWQPQSIPADCWSRLPEEQDGLIESAADYYGCNQLLMTAGSQAVLQLLPQLRTQHSNIGLFSPSYYEHENAWKKAGHNIVHVTDINSNIDEIDVLVVVNPNNPTGKQFSLSTLLEWQETLAAKGGWLIVDEAFIDSDNDNSLAPFCPMPGLIVLRSLGKFFGLAGIRCGAVIAEPLLLEKINNALGPWALSHPARWIAKQALQDKEWQLATRSSLQKSSLQLAELIAQQLNMESTGTTLFRTIQHPQAELIYEHLAAQGILVRLFAEHQLIRFGLPDGIESYNRLEQALINCKESL